MIEQYINTIVASGKFPLILISAIFPLMLWSIAWKGVALWRAARLGDIPWFIILLVVNTVGILEIIYIYFIAKTKERSVLSTQ